MRGLVKMVGSFLVLSLLMAHLLMVSLFLAPAPKLLGLLIKNDAGFLDPADIPPTVETFITTNKLEVRGDYDPATSFIDQFVLGVLKIRKSKFMNPTQQLALDMNLLSFDEKTVGLRQAATVYYKKPLNKLTDQEWITLINLQKIFSKK